MNCSFTNPSMAASNAGILLVSCGSSNPFTLPAIVGNLFQVSGTGLLLQSCISTEITQNQFVGQNSQNGPGVSVQARLAV
jgi:hypothetical protein